MSPRNLRPLIIAAIVVVCIIGVSVFLLFGRKSDETTLERPSERAVKEDIRPVQSDDHIQGNPAAPIVLVVYSDFECPFCKDYHQTMQVLMKEYGKDGRVAWVFRQFPLVQLHTQAPTEALASECVASIGGNDAFWRFADYMFETTPGNDKFNLAELPNVAAIAGIDRVSFEACMRSGRLMSRVEKDFDEAIAAGGDGTPFTVILAGGQQTRLLGGQPYVAVKAIIDTLLKQVGTTGFTRPGDVPIMTEAFESSSSTDSVDTIDTSPVSSSTSSTTEVVTP